MIVAALDDHVTGPEQQVVFFLVHHHPDFARQNDGIVETVGAVHERMATALDDVGACPGHGPQLFDLKNDPKELNDIAELASKNPQIQETLDEGERRLREICDPEFVNQTCFEDQREKIIQLGGEESCLTAYSFNHTPTPNEQAKMREGSAL